MQNVKRELETQMVVDSYVANGPALRRKMSGNASEASEASGSDAEVSASTSILSQTMLPSEL